jgi:hypothetical protein
MPELHEVPERQGVKVRVLEADGTQHPPAHRDFIPNEVLTFSHIDGMYSLCYDKDNNPVHLVAWQEVEIVE